MKQVQIIIVGGGPAGAACAWQLIKNGRECLVLDKQAFPRQKTCAGWITPRVLADLEFDPGDYPYQLSEYAFLQVSIRGVPLLIPGKQFAIRRWEFDHWLLERSHAPVKTHAVEDIRRVGTGFILDETYRCETLIGAGGTHCPVFHSLFEGEKSRQEDQRIVALEEEYAYSWCTGRPRLWLFDDGLPGYSWYVPKAGGYVNIGVGGNAAVLKARGESIHDHWQKLLERLLRKKLVEERKFQPEGNVYYLRGSQDVFNCRNAYLVGDAAGLATRDMGEGIGPAVQSGLKAAQSILTGKPYDLASIRQLSLLPDFLRWVVE